MWDVSPKKNKKLGNEGGETEREKATTERLRADTIKQSNFEARRNVIPQSNKNTEPVIQKIKSEITPSH
jgi:hypothetical protein